MKHMKFRNVGLGIYVYRPDYLIGNRSAQRWPRDADGQYTRVLMEEFDGECEVEVRFRRGIAPATAVATLQKVIALIDRHGAALLNRPYQPQNPGEVVEDGRIEWIDDLLGVGHPDGDDDEYLDRVPEVLRPQWPLPPAE